VTAMRIGEVVIAARCARQLVLSREGHPVEPEGEATLHVIAQEALVHLASEAPRSQEIIRLLGPAAPDAGALSHACWRMAYEHAYARMAQLASRVDGESLGRIDGVLRDACTTLAELLVGARAVEGTAEEALGRAIRSTATPLHVQLGDVEIEGRLGVLCEDAPTSTPWVWDVESRAQGDRPGQVHGWLCSLELEARGLGNKLVLVHALEATVGKREVQGPGQAEREQLASWLSGLIDEQEGDAPPPAGELDTCRACPAQEPCWARWGRTLPDVDQMPRRSALAPSARPLPRSRPAAPPAEPGDRNFTPPLVWLGEERGTGRAACLEPSDLTRHVAALGVSGSGKTCLAKSIVEEAALAGVPSIVIDLRGDLAQLAAPGQGGGETAELRRRAWVERAEVRLLTPGSDAGLRVSLHPLWAPDVALDEPTRRLCRVAMAEALLGGVRVPDAWGDLAREYLAQVLDTPSGAASLAGLIAQVRQPTELRVEPFVRSRTRRDALAELLRTLLEGEQGHLYTQGRRLSVSDLVEPTPSGKVPVNVLWMPGLGDAHTQHRFVATVLSDVCAWMSRQGSSAPKLLVYLDEIGPFLPPMGESSAKQLVLRILREGGLHGVCGVFCTRNFTEVDYKVLAQAGTLLLGRLGSTLDKARVRKMLPSGGGFDAAGAAEMLTTTGVGRFLVSNVDRFGAPRVLQARMPLTQHGRPWGEDDVRKLVTEEMRRGWC